MRVRPRLGTGSARIDTNPAAVRASPADSVANWTRSALPVLSDQIAAFNRLGLQAPEAVLDAVNCEQVTKRDGLLQTRKHQSGPASRNSSGGRCRNTNFSGAQSTRHPVTPLRIASSAITSGPILNQRSLPGGGAEKA